MATLVKAENLHNDATVIAACSVKIVCLKKAVSKQTEHFFPKQRDALYMKPVLFSVAGDINSQ